MFLSVPKTLLAHREHSLSYLLSGAGACTDEHPQPVCPALELLGANWATPAAGKEGLEMAWEPEEELAFLGQLFHSYLNGGGHLGLRRSVRAQ